MREPRRSWRGARPFAALALVFFAACENTPIDAVYREDTPLPDAGLPDAAGDAATCTSTREPPEVGRYRFFSASSARCMASGNPTTVVGRPAFTTQTSANCGSNFELWDVTSAGLGGFFHLRNVGLDRYLDVERGLTQPGTRVLLYELNALPNQQFVFRPRSNGEFEIAPAHAPGSCLTADGGDVELWPCTTADERQNWTSFLTDCR